MSSQFPCVPSRRQVLLLGGALALSQFPLSTLAATRELTVYKDPSCGCCTAWADIMTEAGFKVSINHLDDLSGVRLQAGVPAQVEGCHMALLDKYVLEGHVPLAAIEKLLADRPAIRGIAVPGMPAGSPGMGDDPAARYDVIAFNDPSGGDAYVFHQVGG